MNNVKKATGLALAIAAAGLAGCMNGETKPQAAAAENVHCYGVTSCKGQNDCKTAENACKGQAVCKGHGFVSIPASECDAKGGKVGA